MEHLFSNMPVDVKENTVLGYLGFRKGNIPPEHPMMEEIRRNISALRPNGVCKLVDVKTAGGLVDLSQGNRVVSQGFLDYLAGCTKALLMASTLGERVSQRVNELLREGEAERGVILDACASACADAGLDFMLKMRKPYLFKMGYEMLSTRFSPGYGDMPLSFQRSLFLLLDAGRLGISLTQGNMLYPEKSVLAVCGVKER